MCPTTTGMLNTAGHFRVPAAVSNAQLLAGLGDLREDPFYVQALLSEGMRIVARNQRGLPPIEAMSFALMWTA